MKKYPIYKTGDKVFTHKENWKSITKDKEYIVISCQIPPGFIEGCEFRTITVMNDMGFVCTYATDKFKKTFNQIRKDKVLSLLS